jgi:RNA polymerase sigma factor (sigma-70 family)
MRTIQAAAFIAAEVDRDQEITLGERIKFWRKAKAEGTANPRIERQSQNAASKLAEVNQRYLPNILRRYWGYPGIENDELWTSGFLGLVRAAQSYDPDKGYFWYFARKFVLGEIQDLFRKNQLIILPKDKFAKAQNDPALKTLLNCTELNDEILEWKNDDVSDGWDCVNNDLRKAINSLPAHLKEVIERSYGIGCAKVTQSQIAFERGVSDTAISNQKQKAQELIKDFLEKPESDLRLVEVLPEPKKVEATPEIESEVVNELLEVVVVDAAPEIPEPKAEPTESVLKPKSLSKKINEIWFSAISGILAKPFVSQRLQGFFQTASKVTESILGISAVEEVEKGKNPDNTMVSTTELTMKCLKCTADIPKPLEGVKVSCSLCSTQFDCDEKGVLSPAKPGSEDTPIVYKDASLKNSMSAKEQRDHERNRNITLNDLAQIHAELADRGPQFEGVRTRILNLWRETKDYRIFDEAAMERVECWIYEVEQVENQRKRNTA